MTVGECIEKHTHRQYVAWMRWLDQQYNVPSRSDWYLMRLMQVVTGLAGKQPPLDKFRVPFEIGPKSEAEKRARGEQSKGTWGAILGMTKAAIQSVPKAGSVIKVMRDGKRL